MHPSYLSHFASSAKSRDKRQREIIANCIGSVVLNIIFFVLFYLNPLLLIDFEPFFYNAILDIAILQEKMACADFLICFARL